MKLTISAVIPVYNVENYLEDCLNSIVNQIVPFSEVVLVNDGSTDNSRKICEEYCERYPYFTLIHQKNAGPSAARNAGIRMATGEYVVFIDADDIVKNNLLFKLKEALSSYRYDIVFYDADVWYEERKGEPVNYFKRGRQFYGRNICGRDYLSESFPGHYIVSPWTAAYKRQFIKECNIYFQEGIYFEDNDFCLRTYLMAEEIKCMDEILYVRRCRNGSIMAEVNTYKKCMDLIQANLTVWNIIEKSGMDILFRIHFVAYYFINVWKAVRKSDYYWKVQNKWKYLLTVFHNVWLDRYLSEDIALDDRLALFLFYNEWESMCPIGIENSKKVREQIEKGLIHKLFKISFADADRVVGIYGIGKHTEKMLELYKKYIGEIKSSLFFIVTEKQQNITNYRGYPLVTTDCLPKGIEWIVISSLVYQTDMKEQLEKVGIAEEKIVELYAENEFCDLSMIAEILED